MIRQAYPNELMHSGIKGQRWGVRRFQNEDRTWTSAGKARYGSGKIEKKARKERAIIDDARKTAKTDDEIEREEKEAADISNAKAAAKANKQILKDKTKANKLAAKELAKAMKEADRETAKALKDAEKKEVSRERLKKAAVVATVAIGAYAAKKIYDKRSTSYIKGKEIFDMVVTGKGTSTHSDVKSYKVIDAVLDTATNSYKS